MTSAVQTFVGSAGQPGGHLRRYQSPIAALEKRILVQLASRMPRWVTPDQLSALGFVAMCGTAAAFATARWQPKPALLLVPLLLAVNWFGDSLDGTLARVRRIERPRYGFYLDHVLDLAGTSMLFAGLAWSQLMHPLVALVTLAAFLLVTAESFLATHARGVFRMSFLGFGPTELRLLLATGAVWVAGGAHVAPFGLGPYRLFDIGGLAADVGLVTAFAVASIGNIISLYRQETVSVGKR